MDVSRGGGRVEVGVGINVCVTLYYNLKVIFDDCIIGNFFSSNH
jgi:hypothetical protein